MIKMHITETGRNNLKEEPQTFNIENKFFNSSDEIKEHLVERYGKLPKMKNKVFVDTKSGETICVGFIHSFWNQGCSHNSPRWYQTDWITFEEVNTKNIELKQLFA
jgi:hypothetical protein